MKKQIAIDLNTALSEIKICQAKLDDKSTWGNSSNLKKLLKLKWKLFENKNHH